ncbi:MAG: hypothetical protein ABI651_04045 [Verrucomicrobiota bacterium]
MRAYTGLETLSWMEAAPRCIIAALSDVAIIFVLYGTGALAAGSLLWASRNSWNVYGELALFGLSYVESLVVQRRDANRAIFESGAVAVAATPNGARSFHHLDCCVLVAPVGGAMSLLHIANGQPAENETFICPP